MEEPVDECTERFNRQPHLKRRFRVQRPQKLNLDYILFMEIKLYYLQLLSEAIDPKTTRILENDDIKFETLLMFQLGETFSVSWIDRL